MSRSAPVPRLYVVDNDPATLRTTLAWLGVIPGVQLVGFGSAEAFLAGVAAEVPGVLVLEHELPGLSGEALVEQLAASIELAVVMLCASPTLPLAVRLVRRGVKDVLAKPSGADALVGLVRSLLAKEMEDWPRRVARRSHVAAVRSLSRREREVMEQLLRGGTNKDVAQTLDISPRTVEIHRSRVLGKLGVSSVVELMHRRITLAVERPR